MRNTEDHYTTKIVPESIIRNRIRKSGRIQRAILAGAIMLGAVTASTVENGQVDKNLFLGTAAASLGLGAASYAERKQASKTCNQTLENYRKSLMTSTAPNTPSKIHVANEEYDTETRSRANTSILNFRDSAIYLASGTPLVFFGTHGLTINLISDATTTGDVRPTAIGLGAVLSIMGTIPAASDLASQQTRMDAYSTILDGITRETQT